MGTIFCLGYDGDKLTCGVLCEGAQEKWQCSSITNLPKTVQEVEFSEDPEALQPLALGFSFSKKEQTDDAITIPADDSSNSNSEPEVLALR